MHSNTTGTTHARIEAIKGFYKPGITSQQIADNLARIEGKAITRATVIGIYNRNKDALKNFPLNPYGYNGQEFTHYGKVPKQKPRAKTRKAAAPRPAPKPVSNVLQFATREPAPEYAPDHPTKLLWQLAAIECRWPVDGVGAETQFCSQHRSGESSYCEHHRVLSIGQGSRGERQALKTLKRYG